MARSEPSGDAGPRPGTAARSGPSGQARSEPGRNLAEQAERRLGAVADTVRERFAKLTKGTGQPERPDQESDQARQATEHQTANQQATERQAAEPQRDEGRA